MKFFTTAKWPRRLAATLLFLLPGILPAAEPADPSLKLREQLRAVTLQLRTAQTESANAQAAAAAADQKSADLTTKLADLEKRDAVLAKQTAADKATAAQSIATLEAKVADRERKNISLFNTANEILDRYENYSLGKALQAREPFIGTTRVKVENLVQGYHDKILDNRIQAPKGH